MEFPALRLVPRKVPDMRVLDSVGPRQARADQDVQGEHVRASGINEGTRTNATSTSTAIPAVYQPPRGEWQGPHPYSVHEELLPVPESIDRGRGGSVGHGHQRRHAAACMPGVRQFELHEDACQRGRGVVGRQRQGQRQLEAH